MINFICAREPIAKSIFLAGPTPRDPETKSWRPRAMSLLQEFGFDGTVFVPEARTEERAFEYDDQVKWEWEALASATVIVFWVPRELKKMPAMVTNVEFGLYVASGKVVFGTPPEAQKMSYLKALATRYSLPVYTSLEDTLNAAIVKTEHPYGQ